MFQNAARPRGRPRSFDERDALEKATQVFWSKGYDGVTIDDLVAGMGVGRPSLYSVFGDKRTLFLRVLKAYAETKGALAAKALFSPRTLRDSLASFLRHRRNCDRGRIRPGMSSRVRRAARGRC
jgi:AcrR family transcriptional regulator